MSKVKKRALSLLLAFAMVFTMMPEVPAFAAKAVMQINYIIDEAVFKTLTAGQSDHITGKATMSNATASDAPWATASDAVFKASSSNADVSAKAKIDSNGNFDVTVKVDNSLAKDAEVTITFGYPELDCVTEHKFTAKAVSGPVITDPKVVKITLPGTFSTEAGKPGQITAEIEASPSDATYNPTVVWKSNNPDITVTGTGAVGTVIASKAGEAMITATADGVDSNECEVTITPSGTGDVIKVEEVLLSNGTETGKEITWTLSEGFGNYLIASVKPENAANQEVIWKSSKPEIAAVDENGFVEAIAKGETDITAISKADNSKSAVCHLTVKPVDIKLGFNNLEMVIGSEKAIDVTISGYNGKETVDVPYALKGAKVEVADKNIASADASVDDSVNPAEATLLVKAIKAGTTSVTVTLDSASAVCNLTVADKATTTTDILEAADRLEEALNGGDPAEMEEAIVSAISAAAKVDFENPAEAEALEVLESVVFGAFSDVLLDPDLISDDTVTNLSFSGAIMNLLDKGILSVGMGSATIKPVLKVQEVDKDTIGIPASAKEDAVAFDLTLSALIDEEEEELNSLAVPVVITLDIPSKLTEAENLKIYHYLSNGSRTTITPVDNGDGTLTFATKSFSTFVILDAPRSSSNGGNGGGSGHSSSGGSFSSGNLAGSWVQDAVGWWFKTTTNGYPANQWAKINNKLYHFNEAGYMQTGWLNDNGGWYWLNTDGSMAETTWMLINGQWYYLHVGGRMLGSQWFQSSGQWYYLNADGSMAVSTATPDGRAVDANGVWIQ